MQRRAQAIYHELTGAFTVARVEATTPVPPSRELRNKVTANRIRYAKRRQAEERASRTTVAEMLGDILESEARAA